MRLESVELVHVRVPLVGPFRTSFGTMTTRDTFLLRVQRGEASFLTALTKPS